LCLLAFSLCYSNLLGNDNDHSSNANDNDHTSGGSGGGSNSNTNDNDHTSGGSGGNGVPGQVLQIVPCDTTLCPKLPAGCKRTSDTCCSYRCNDCPTYLNCSDCARDVDCSWCGQCVRNSRTRTCTTKVIQTSSGCPATNVCPYNRQMYQSGATFPSADGCNQCSCRNGVIYCTRKSCNCVIQTVTHKNGEFWVAADNCNTCLCNKGTVQCSGNQCERTTCVVGGNTYNHGDAYNGPCQGQQCICQNGQSLCTNVLQPDCVPQPVSLIPQPAPQPISVVGEVPEPAPEAPQFIIVPQPIQEVPEPAQVAPVEVPEEAPQFIIVPQPPLVILVPRPRPGVNPEPAPAPEPQYPIPQPASVIEPEPIAPQILP